MRCFNIHFFFLIQQFFIFVLHYHYITTFPVFNSASAFNSDLSAWNVAAVSEMSYSTCNNYFKIFLFNANLFLFLLFLIQFTMLVFNSATVFNSDLSKWNVDVVSGMSYSTYNNYFCKVVLFNADVSFYLFF